MPALLPQDAQLLQPCALAQTLGPVLVLQVVIQRAIGKTQLEVFDHLRRLQAALDEILLRSRRLLQRAVVVIDHDAQQLLIVHVPLKQGRQLGHRALLRWRLGCAGRGRQIVPLEQFHGVRKADAFGPHHPQNHVASFAARALAVPNVFHRVDVEARARVSVEGAKADQFLAAAPQLDAPRLGESLDGDFPLDPLLQLRGNVGHRLSAPSSRFSSFLEKTCQEDSSVQLVHRNVK